MKKAIINGKLVYPEGITEGVLLMENGRIVSGPLSEVPADAEVIDAAGLYVGPGLIDEHVHGFHKGDKAYDIIDDARAVAREHLKCGTTAILPSPSYSLKLSQYLSVIEQCLCGIEAGESIVGIHLEGPYINHTMGAGRKFAWKFDAKIFESLFTAGRGHVRMCTYAPEMRWGEEVEEIISRQNARLAIGHTSADPASLERARRKGARIATHLFDGTGHYLGVHAFDKTGDPQDSVSDVLLGFPDMYYELICDSVGAHTSPYSQRLALKCAGEDHIILISDCTLHKRALLEPENYDLSVPDVNFGKDGRIFGSRLTVADSAANFRKSTDIGMQGLFKCASTNAAAALGLREDHGSIETGRYANIVFADEEFRILTTIYKGETVRTS